MQGPAMNAEKLRGRGSSPDWARYKAGWRAAARIHFARNVPSLYGIYRGYIEVLWGLYRDHIGLYRGY